MALGTGTKLFYAGVTIALVLLAGKLLRLPIALMVVYGSSMKPSLQPFDLVLGVDPSLAGGVERGDIVVWCYPGDVWRTSCVVHRVIDVREVDGEYILITKGDALPQPDPPIRSSRVSYVVVAHIPNYVVLLLIALLYGAGVMYCYVYLPYTSHRRRLPLYPGVMASLLIAYYIILEVAFIGLSALDVSPMTINFPGLYMEDLSFNPRLGLVNITLSYNSSLFPIQAPECRVVAPVNATPILEEFTVSAANGSANVVLRIPPSFFHELWRVDSERFSREALPPPPTRVATAIVLNCTLPFNKGVLRSTYPLLMYWMEPTIKPSYGNGSVLSVLIENHNPVPFNVSVEVYSHYQNKVIYRRDVALEPFAGSVVELPKTREGDVLEVRVYYVFLGHLRGVRVTVHA
ncbi:signal peptidase I [Stetteria hydrogenophila]